MLAILTTHPIQYQVPLWQRLAQDDDIPFEVWYLTKHGVSPSHDLGFGKSFAWDLDMLSGYPHRFLDVDPSATPNTFWECRLRGDFAQLLREAKAKAVWTQGWQVAAYWQAVWAAKKIGADVWLRGESNDLAPAPLWKRAIKRVILGQLFRRVDRFLYIGSANRRLYEKFGVSADRLYPAPYAVDNERFARQAEEIGGGRSASGSGEPTARREIRGQWGIPEDAFCVLFCGKFIPKKHPMDLVKAAQLLITNNRLSNIHLLFAGSGELGGKLRAHCNVVFDAESSSAPNNKEQITNNGKPAASFAGFLNQTEISKAYVAADCLILPSDYGETWGLVVNEAMASGLRCVISDQCGCACDLGGDGGNAIYPRGNIDVLADTFLGFRWEARRIVNEETRPPSLSASVETVRMLYSESPGAM